MLILACDTSNSTCSAGLYEDDRQIAYELSLEKKTHSETFMPLVHRVMEKSGYEHSELDLYAAVTGPGSFTGIRIGLAAVKGMALAANKKCIGVTSTEALARSVTLTPGRNPDNTILIPAFDARNNRVFAAAYLASDMSPLIDVEACDASEFITELCTSQKMSGKHVIVMGDGSEVIKKNIEGRIDETSIEYASGATILPSGVAASALERIRKEGEACLIDSSLLNAGYYVDSSANRQKK